MKTICRQEAIEKIYRGAIETVKELLFNLGGRNGFQRKNNEYLQDQLLEWTGEEYKVVNRTQEGGKGSRS